MEFYNNISDKSLDDAIISIDQTEVEYQAFDASLIRSKFCEKSLQDLLFLLTLATIRGTNLTKIVKKVKDETAAKIQKLILQYSIKDKASSSTDVTLGRIMSTFPELISLLILRGKIIPKVMVTGLPAHYCFSSAPALIDNPNIMNLWDTWSHYFNEQINSDKNKTEKKDLSEKSLLVGRIIAENTHVDVITKVGFMNVVMFETLGSITILDIKTIGLLNGRNAIDRAKSDLGSKTFSNVASRIRKGMLNNNLGGPLDRSLQFNDNELSLVLTPSPASPKKTPAIAPTSP